MEPQRSAVTLHARQSKIKYWPGYPALAFPDVYLYPQYSDIRSRHGADIDTSTVVAKGMPRLKIPFISAGMDTVTEDEMASTMALNGGLGEIHRNNTADHQAELVRRVKEKMRLIEDNPPMVSEKATIADALSLLQKRQRGYVIVYKGRKYTGEIVGMATSRDFEAGILTDPITQVMTPLKSHSGRRLIVVSQNTTSAQAIKIMQQKRIEKIPVMDRQGKLVGVYALKDFANFQKYPNAVLDKRGRLVVGAAIGVHEIDIDRAHKLVAAGVDVIFLDIAHGHHKYTQEMVKRLKIKEKISVPLVVGNVATRDGVMFAYKLGADGIKVGIGPGFVCRTRDVSGTGVPQITAILEARKALKNIKNPPPLIADGGIRQPGDVPKAIAVGADSVMIGTLFAGTDKSPGEIVKHNGALHKKVRGMASKKVQEDRMKLGDSTTNPKLYAPEGTEKYIPYQGAVEDLLFTFIGGLRSGMSYVGAHNITEMKQASLLHVSAHGSNEQYRGLE